MSVAVQVLTVVCAVCLISTGSMHDILGANALPLFLHYFVIKQWLVYELNLGIQAALLVVAADAGPMPQTHEHLDIMSIIGLKPGIIALTNPSKLIR